MKLDLTKFEPLLGEWWYRTKYIFEKEEMYNIYQEMKEISASGIKITPKSSDLWKFLKECPLYKLKVIFIGLDSYPGIYPNGNFHADGIAFSNSYSPDKKCQPSLEYFWDGLSEDLGIKLEHKNDLTFLANQGVLLGNRALACKLYQTGSLLGKFDFFWEEFFTNIIGGFSGIPIVLVGKDAQYLSRYINTKQNYLFQIEHPSYAARKNQTWSTNKTFTEITKILKENNNLYIDWSGKNPYIDEEPPF